MIHFFAEVTCPFCENPNRIVIDKESEEERFVMLGDSMNETIEENGVLSTCEYCFHEFQSYIIVKENIFSKIANPNEYKNYQKDPSLFQAAQEGQGIKNEGKQNNNAKHYVLSFKQQPFQVNETIYLSNARWKVITSYKKEHSERDPETRMLMDFTDAYYYEVENENKKRKWLEVVNAKGENAQLSMDPPVVLMNETLYDISESDFKSTFLFEQEMGIQYKIKAYHHLSGIQMVVFFKEEENESVVLDLLGDSVEELYEELEEWINGQRDGEMEYVSTNDSDYQPE